MLDTEGSGTSAMTRSLRTPQPVVETWQSERGVESLFCSLVKATTGESSRKLWAAAKQSSSRRFHALFDRVYRGDVLWEGWEHVRANT
jgi:hypothetical protein